MKLRYITMFIGVLFATTACDDDYFNRADDNEYSDYIGYNVTLTGNDQFLSRSGGDAPHNSRQLTIENTGETIGGRPLYLHTEVVDSIPMSVSRAKNSATPSRGTITTNPADIGISAVVFDGDKNAWPNDEKTAEAQMYMHNEKLTSPWQTNRYWPRENSWIRFYAYSPYNILGENGLPVISTTEPSFSYTVDNDITEQQDLLVGSEQYIGGWCQTAQLDMCHALAAVKIHIDGNVSDFTLKELTIEGLNNSGTYTYKFDSGATSDGKNDTQTHDAGVWTDQSGTAKYTLYHDETGMPLTTITEDANNNSLIDPETGKSTGYTDMTAGNMVLLMMPQTLTANAKITITGYDEILKQDGVKLSATIGNGVKQWEKGKMYTYTLSFSSTKIEYTITAEATDNVNIPYYGIKDRGYRVVSYKTVTRSGLGSKTYAVPWKAVQIDANGKEIELPAGLILSEPSGTGVDMENQTSEDYTYCLLPNIDDGSSISHSTISGLNSIPAKSPVLSSTKSQPYDLSTEALYDVDKDPKNTANSYMIFAPGYYTFPLVYGNAITNGSNNTSAYKGYNGTYTQTYEMTDFEGNGNGTYVTVPCKGLANFVDHNNNAIEGPWIVPTSREYGSGPYTPKKVEIVWQDEPCLVSELDFNAEKDYITFRVHEDAACDGNAVIAVKDENDEIMWSWHIWVNDGSAYHNLSSTDSWKQPYINQSTKKFSTITNTNRRVTSADWEDSKWGIASKANTYTGQNFSTFRVFLGLCDGENKIYNARDIVVRFKQVEADDAMFVGEPTYAEVTFSQQGGTASTVNNIPYYQYGRKDPMLPTGDGTNDKVWYDNNWNKVISGQSKANSKASLSEAIRNPQTFYAEQSRTRSNYLQNFNWCSDGTFMNLWNSKSWSVPAFPYHSLYNSAGKRHEYHKYYNNLIASGVTKSVYDPCPPGYEMPRIDAFTGATYHGMNLYPLWYNKPYATSLFAFGNQTGATFSEDSKYGYHMYSNLWINPYDKPYQSESEYFNAISIYSTAMVASGQRGTGIDDGGESLPVPFFGHRNSEGKIASYGTYASALTCGPVCTQNIASDQDETMETFARYMLSRLCIIKGTDGVLNTGKMIPYSLRVFSGSDFDLAFGVIPAQTGKNPNNTTISGNPNWGGDHSDIEVGF